MTIQEIILRLQNTRKNSTGYTAKCPAHNDKKNSLSIAKKADKIMLFCLAIVP